VASLPRALAIGSLVGVLVWVPLAASARQEPATIRARTVEIETGAGESVLFDG
jgi:hypothetical protein